MKVAERGERFCEERQEFIVGTERDEDLFAVLSRPVAPLAVTMTVSLDSLCSHRGSYSPRRSTYP